MCLASRSLRLAQCPPLRRSRCRSKLPCPTGQSADQCAARHATSDEAKVALVVIAPGSADGVGINVVRFAIDFDGAECHTQARRNMQAARIFGVDHAARHVRTRRDDRLSQLPLQILLPCPNRMHSTMLMTERTSQL